MNVTRFFPVVRLRSSIASAVALCLVPVVAPCGETAEQPGTPPAARRSHIQPVGEVAVATRNADTLGLRLARASEVLRQQLALGRGAGLVVEEVMAGSPAERAGFRQHDVLVLLDDQMLLLPEQLAALLEATGPDGAAECTLLRGGTKVKLALGLGEPAGEPTLATASVPAAKPALPAAAPAERATAAAVRTAAKPSAGAGLRPAASALALVQPRDSAPPAPATAPPPATRVGASASLPPRRPPRGQPSGDETLLRHDADYQIKLSRGEQTRLVVIDARGRILFNDQIDTQENRGLVPIAVRERVAEMERALESQVSPAAFEVGRLDTAPVEVR